MIFSLLVRHYFQNWLYGEVSVFGFGVPELLIILVIVLVVFGAGRLPEIGGALGKSIRNFKKASDGKDEIEINPKKDESTKS